MNDQPTVQVHLDKIRPPNFNSRLDFDSDAARAELAELAASMEPRKGQRNQLQPVIVELLEDGSYLLVAGSRRYEAAKMNGWESISATVRPPTDPLRRIVDNGIENLRRRGLSTFEMGRLFAECRDQGASGPEIAKEFGTVREVVTKYSNAYIKLVPEIREEWQAGHEVATINFLAELSRLPAQEQLAAWNKRVELYRVSQDVLEADVPDADDDEEDAGGGGAAPKGETAGAPEPPFKVSQGRYKALLQALRKAKTVRQAGFAVACLKYLVGRAVEVPGIISDAPAPEEVEVQTPAKKGKKS